MDLYFWCVDFDFDFVEDVGVHLYLDLTSELV